eukprot:g7720.t1
MKKLRIMLWVAALALAGVLVWLTLEVTQQKQDLAEAPFGVPFRLVSQDGKTITEQAFRDKPTALFFGFTHCPEVCPTTLFELNGWMHKVDPDGTRLNGYFVSVDPERDTPELLGAYISNVTDRIKGISGPPAEVNEMIKGFKVYAKKVPVDESDPGGEYTMDHTASVFLLGKGGRFVDEKRNVWEASVYLMADEEDVVRERVAEALREPFPDLQIVREVIPDLDWIAKSLEGLKPVRAGRFLVHGSHDRDKIRANDIAIEIEAGQAFGTGHHGTTAGCLEMIDRVLRARTVRRALDLGTGSGVLAIAVRKVMNIPVLATDIDPVAVRVARENVRRNGIATGLRVETAPGFHSPAFADEGPFDLIIANILARPLMKMAPELRRHLSTGGAVILSGILAEQRWKAGKQRVTTLRNSFADLGIDGFLVPRADEYQGEYVPEAAERLAWLTGFTGSAGVALITKAEAVVFVDGRYVTQLSEQVDGTVFTGGDLVNEPPHVWLPAHAAKGFRLGLDPWLHGGAEVKRLQQALSQIDGMLVLLDRNPVDAIWTDRPPEPLGPVSIQRDLHAGKSSKEKIEEIAQLVRSKDAAAVLIADPSSVAWIFNIRGADVPHTPHPLSRAIISASGNAELFIDERKIDAEPRAHLDPLATLHAPAALPERIAVHAADGGRILCDPELTALALMIAVERAGGNVVEATDPARLPRAIKNAAEIRGAADAHLQDGAAMVEFLCWLDQSTPGSLTEIQVVEALEAKRAKVGESMQNPLRDISFDTIAGAGEHAAIMHYRVTRATDRVLNPGELFLIDSGAQYVNGTTDITRTVAVGEVAPDRKRFFTLVLKGMIAISTARFPKGTRGCDLDPLARIALWKAGADFAHGTGHGVGSYLSVHEGPQRISRLSTQELLPGMILSNEPGYYRPGAFGIRIENLICVREAEDVAGGDIPMRGFETLTWCPIDRRLVLSEMMTREELEWLNAYHIDVRTRLLPLLESEASKQWLVQATELLA